MVAVGLDGQLRSGHDYWILGVLALGLLFMAMLYAVHYRESHRKLLAMGEPVATLEVTESTFSVTSGAGAAQRPWTAIQEIWRFDTCWLLLFSKAQFVTLPLADLTPEAADFVLERVRTAGGKLR